MWFPYVAVSGCVVANMRQKYTKNHTIMQEIERERERKLRVENSEVIQIIKFCARKSHK